MALFNLLFFSVGWPDARLNGRAGTFLVAQFCGLLHVGDNAIARCLDKGSPNKYCTPETVLIAGSLTRRTALVSSRYFTEPSFFKAVYGSTYRWLNDRKSQYAAGRQRRIWVFDVKIWTVGFSRTSVWPLLFCGVDWTKSGPANKMPRQLTVGLAINWRNVVSFTFCSAMVLPFHAGR